MEVVWSNNQVSMLIELYQQHSVLWDASNNDYKDKLKKNNAWADIATKLNMSQKEVETKMHILRSQFSREKKKLESLKIIGSSSEEVIKSRWQWYDPLRFLLRGATTTSGKSDTMGALQDCSASTPPSNKPLSVPPPLPRPPPPLLSQSNNSKKRKCDENLNEAYEIIKSAKKKMEEPKDEFEIYGQYVASELRNVKNQRSLLQAKYYINNILIQARMGNYDNTNFGEYHGYGDRRHDFGDRYRTTSSSSADASTPTQTPEPQVHTGTGDEFHFSSIDEIVSFKGTEATHETIEDLNLGTKQHLSATPLQVITLNDAALNHGSPIILEDEPISVKEEEYVQVDELADTDSVDTVAPMQFNALDDATPNYGSLITFKEESVLVKKEETVQVMTFL